MKKIIISLVLALLALPVLGQDDAPLTRQEKKMLRKEQKKQYEKMLEVNTSKAISSGFFVLKADQVRSRYGVVYHVNSSINFIAIQGKEAFVQLGSESGIGANGVGGITLKGEVTNYSVEQDKDKGSYFIKIYTSSTAGSLTIMMQVNNTGEMSTATVTTNWGSRVDFTGTVVPVTGSRVFKGTETM